MRPRDLKKWNLQQIMEVKSELNRYYFFLRYGRPARNFDELFMFYVESGGAKNFREKHKDE